jgi:ribonuclease P protein component
VATVVGQCRGLAIVQRLKTRPQFQAALAGGTVSRTAHFALHRLNLAPPADTSLAPALTQGPAPSPEQALFGLFDVWLGAMVPKRWARRAVTRNAIKRQIYNVSERFGDRLPVAAHVVRLRTTFDRQRFHSATSEPLKLAVREELVQLFERAVHQKVLP